MKDGRTPPALASREKRFASNVAPVCNKENCIMCNMCSFVCPHAVIRPYLLDEEEYQNAPQIIKDNAQPANIKGENLWFLIAASAPDCTGCGLCEKICPGKKGVKAISMTDILSLKKNGMIDSL